MTVVKVQLATRERPCDSMERQLTGGNRPQRGCYGLATHSSRLHYPIRVQEPPYLATKSSKRRIPLESARTGAQEDSQTDPPVMTLGMDMTSKEGRSKTLSREISSWTCSSDLRVWMGESNINPWS